MDETKNIVISAGKYLLMFIVGVIIFSILTKGRTPFERGGMLGELIITVFIVAGGYELGKHAVKKYKNRGGNKHVSRTKL